MSVKKASILFLTALLLIGAFSLPVLAAETTPAAGPAWTIYFYPQVRWGNNDRTIYSFDFLIPFYQGEKNILFFNPKYSLDNLGGSEVNLGFGYRHLLFSDRAVLGINGYYDSRRTDWGTRHEQVGIGAEVMTNWVTGRFNGYFAVTDPQIGDLNGLSSEYYFRDIGLYMSSGSLEETLSGFDGELGFKIPGLSKYVETWVYAGGYHFEGEYVKDVDGFSTRVEVVPTDFLRLNFEYRNDTLYHDQYYGEVAVAVPFSVDNLFKGKNPFEGFGSHIGGDRTLKERMVEPVRRDVDVRVYVAGSGPGEPGTETLVEDIVFVSETGDDTIGDGTFENPYKSVEYASTYNDRILSYVCSTIHVMNIDDVNSAEGGIINRDGLLIWGSGVDRVEYPVISNMTNGYPDVVAYAGASYVLSVDFENTTITGLGLTTPSAGGGTVYGILVNNGSGLEVSYNEIGSGIVNGYGIYGNIAGYIGALGLPALFQYNTIELVSGDTGVGIYFGADNIYATFTGNTITGTANHAEGITLVSIGDIGSSGTPVTFDSNIINLTGNEARGITYIAGLDDFDVTDIDFTALAGGDFGSLPSVSGSGSADVDFTSNTITLNGNDAALGITGIIVGDHTADVTGNAVAVLNGGVSSGILLGAGDALTATITGANSVAVAGYYAALGITGVGVGLDGSTTNLTISGNTVGVGSGYVASGILAGSGAGLTATITDHTNFQVNGGYAALGITAVGANYFGGDTGLTITDNTLSLFSPSGGTSGILFGSGGNLVASIVNNTITGEGSYAATGITAATCILGGYADIDVFNNTIDLTSNEGGISGILLASLGGLYSDVGGSGLGNTITGHGKYAALGITQFGLSWLDTGVYENTIDISSGYLASGILLGAGGDLYADVIGNILGPSSIVGNAVALGITAVNYDGEFDTVITDNVLNIQAEGAELPAYEIASFLDTLPYVGDILDPAAFDSSPYSVGIASGIMALSINGSSYYTDISNNSINVDGISLAAGITTANILGDLGSDGDPISISENTLTVSSGGGGSVAELVSDLASGLIGTTFSWNNALEGYDGGASGIAMLTTGDLYADVNDNTMTVSGGLGALGITAFGDDIELDIFRNNFVIDSGGVSSGILMLAMDSIDYAGIYNNNAGEDELDTYHIKGDYAALGVTGIALALDGGYSFIDFVDNEMYLDSGGVSSGLLLASGGGLGSYLDSNAITAKGTYAALGFSQFSLDNSDIYMENTSIDVESDYFASGILAVAGNNLSATITGEDLAHTPINVSGDAFALGVTLMSVDGSIDSDLLYTDLNVAATGAALDIGEAASFLATLPYVGSFVDPTMFEDTPYNIGAASGLMMLSVYGDASGIIQSNDITVQGQSLAAGITVASIFGGIGQVNPLNIGSSSPGYGNTIDVTAFGGGDLLELASDLVVGYTGVSVPWSDGDLIGLDGAALGITLLTTGDLLAGVEGNDLDVYGGLGALGVTAFGYDVGSTVNPLAINSNDFTIDSPYVSSGILMIAMNRLNASVNNNNMGQYYDDETYINGGYAALGITGIGLNLDDDNNFVYASGNTMALGSANGVTSGILLASLNNISFDIESNDITHYNYWGEDGTSDDVTTTSKYAALGITAISGDDIGIGTTAVVSNNDVWTDSDYLASGILLLAVGDLTANVTYNNVSNLHDGGSPISGDAAALGITLLSYVGTIDSDINDNNLNVLAAGGQLPLGGDDGIFSFINGTITDTGLDPDYYGTYDLGIASGILVASFEGDIESSIIGNGTSNLRGLPASFRVEGATLATGITLASWDGDLNSDIIGNALTVLSPGTGGTGIDQLLADFTADLGDPVLSPTLFPLVDGSAAGVMLLTGNGGIYTDVINNSLINVQANSMAAGILMYTWDGGIGYDDLGTGTGRVTISGNTNINVSSNIYGVGILGVAGLDLDDGSSGSGSLTNDIFADIHNNGITVTSDNSIGLLLFASGWIGSSTSPLLFNNNSGEIYGASNQIMMILIGNAGTAASPNYLDWSGVTYPSPYGGGAWTGFYPTTGSQIGALIPYAGDPLGWNITPLFIP